MLCRIEHELVEHEAERARIIRRQDQRRALAFGIELEILPDHAHGDEIEDLAGDFLHVDRHVPLLRKELVHDGDGEDAVLAFAERRLDIW